MAKFNGNIREEYNPKCKSFNICEVYDKLNSGELNECHSNPHSCIIAKDEELEKRIHVKGKIEQTSTPLQEVAKVSLKEFVDAAKIEEFILRIEESKLVKAHILELNPENWGAVYYEGCGDCFDTRDDPTLDDPILNQRYSEVRLKQSL